MSSAAPRVLGCLGLAAVACTPSAPLPPTLPTPPSSARVVTASAPPPPRETPGAPASREVWRLPLESTDYIDPFGVAVGPDGRVAVVGQLRHDLVIPDAVDATYGYGTQSFVLELNADGTYRWHQVLAGLVTEVTTVAYGASGALVIAGTARQDLPCTRRAPSADRTTVFVATYDAAGTRGWCRVLGGTEHASSAMVTTTPSGRIWAAADFSGAVDLGGGPLVAGDEGNVLIVALDAAGEHLFSRQLGANEVHLSDLAATKDEGVVVAGRYAHPMDVGAGRRLPYDPPPPDAEVALPASYVVRLRADGRVADAWRLGDRGHVVPAIHSVAPHPSGAVLVGGVGRFVQGGEPAELGDADSFAVGLSPGGAMIFAHGAQPRSIHGVAVALDPDAPHLRGVVAASTSLPAPPATPDAGPTPRAALTVVDELDGSASPIALGDGWVNDVVYASAREVVMIRHEPFEGRNPSRGNPLRAVVVKLRLP